MWRRVYGLIPVGPDGQPLDGDHLGGATLCQRPDHLELVTKAANVKWRGSARGPNKRGDA
jgi:hypothetical protein